VTPRLGMAPLRREQIVRATIRCLARDGYAGLTMRGVAAEAEVSQGILHYYFRDKAAMLAAAARRVTLDLDRRVATEAQGARNARERLRAVIRACLRAAVDNRDFWTVFIEFWGEAFHDRRLAAVNRQAYARARGLIGASLARGVADGEFRRINVDEAAAVVLAAETALVRYLASGDPT
jgi:TetR/AcrR family transcriptional repressor of bet genes